MGALGMQTQGYSGGGYPAMAYTLDASRHDAPRAGA
jgi:hypothetical protein